MTKPAKSKAKWRVKRYTGMAKVLSAKSRSIITKPKKPMVSRATRKMPKEPARM